MHGQKERKLWKGRLAIKLPKPALNVKAKYAVGSSLNYKWEFNMAWGPFGCSGKNGARG